MVSKSRMLAINRKALTGKYSVSDLKAIGTEVKLKDTIVEKFNIKFSKIKMCSAKIYRKHKSHAFMVNCLNKIRVNSSIRNFIQPKPCGFMHLIYYTNQFIDGYKYLVFRS